MQAVRPGKLPEAEAQGRIKARVSRETYSDLERYADLLTRWQARINLIGPATASHIWERHIEDSLKILPYLTPFLDQESAVLADMGAGAGLPSIPLALHLRANQSVFVHLVDSNIKKASFLREAVRALQLDAEVHHKRLEAMQSENIRPEPQVIVARALAPLSELVGYAAPWLENGATGLFQKGRHVENELAETASDERLQYKAVTLDEESGSSLVIVRKKGRDDKITP